MPKVFLSYARSDKDVVDRISRDLRRYGVDFWMDRQDLMPGQKWLPQIQQAIADAEFMVVFLSSASLRSDVVRIEFARALERQSKALGHRLIPALLEKVPLPAAFAETQYVDFTESYLEGLQQLLRAMEVPAGPSPTELLPRGFAKEVANEVAKILGIDAQAPTERNAPIDSKLVFVITAFRDDLDPIFEGIEAAGRAVGLEAKRVKDVPGDYRITDQIVRMIHEARLVVADLTHERPNVYFELGYARGLGKTVVTIARDGTPIHFDVKDWTYLTYIDSRILERDIRKRFEYELSGNVGD